MHIVILGCGRAGSRLAQHLLVQGHSVSIIDKDPNAFRLLGADFGGKTVTGVGFDSNVMLEAGIENADAFIAVSSGDNSNLVASKVAKDVFNVPEVIARIYDPRRAEIYKRMGILTVAPVTWGVNRILDILFVEGKAAADMHGGLESELLELDIHIPAKLAGRKVSEFEISGEVKVVAIERGGEVFMPTEDAAFEKGDLAHVAVDRSHMNKLRETFFAS
ncbi:MAG TPA: TrkA family potassium uptake protein [Candidatus Anoxymicrobiaceae bacterium]|jgi:trk system potassium uptake protein